jgi:hypothetical protein
MTSEVQIGRGFQTRFSPYRIQVGQNSCQNLRIESSRYVATTGPRAHNFKLPPRPQQLKSHTYNIIIIILVPGKR